MPADRSRRRRDRQQGGRSPDEIEQHQRPDGSYDDIDDHRGFDDRPQSPDVIEQRQGHDGTFEDRDSTDGIDEPVDPDAIEQRRVVEADDWDEPRQ